MVKRVIPTAREHEPKKERGLSCTFCGPGTWATWEVITDDGVSFTCERHHAEMSEAKIIRLERMSGKETWNQVPDMREMIYEEEYLDDINDYE